MKTATICLVLLGCAALASARMLLESDSVERYFEPRDEDGVDGDGYCDWGGNDFDEYPWAHPRPERDWYCDNTKLFIDEAASRKATGGIPFIIYGDSIMQCLRWQGDQCEGVSEWFEGNWGKKYGAVSWALGSETSRTLFWRMLNGNSPKGLNTKVVMMLIGSNNLGQGPQDKDGQLATAQSLFEEVKSMSQWLMEQDDKLVVLLMGLLPKAGYGSDGKRTITVGPNVAPALDWYNQKLREYGVEEERVRYIGVWDELMDGEEISGDLMGSDRLHPNLAGFKVIANAVDPFLKEYLGQGNATNTTSSDVLESKSIQP